MPRIKIKKNTTITTSDKAVAEIMDEAQRRKNMDAQRQRVIKANWQALRKAGFGYTSKGMPPVRLDYEEERMFAAVMPDGAWKNQRCFIIGGGESLKGFDFSKLKNELVIGVNRAYERIDCTIMFAMDNNLHRWITDGKMGQEVKEKFEQFKGFRVWLDAAGYDYPKGIHVLQKTGGRVLTSSLKEGISGGTNSGFGALGVAVCLGANPIYLLGFDMKGNWWHKGYPDKQGKKKYQSFINDFVNAAPELRKRNIQVINLNPGSELKCFDFGRFEDIKPLKWPMIISYYTRETGYEEEIKNLKNSLKRFNLEYKIYDYPPQGTWRENLNYKSSTILRALEEFPERDIVFLDADAVIRQYPFLFPLLTKKQTHNIAAHFFNYDARSGILNELLSGTLWIQNSERGRRLIVEWHGIAMANPSIIHQRCLKMAIQNLNSNGKIIKVYKLPFEYTCIFDYAKARYLQPVIEHFQASRRLRKEVGYGEHLVKGRTA